MTDSIDRVEVITSGSAATAPIDLVYLDLGGTVVELISYDGAESLQGKNPRGRGWSV